MPIGVLVDVMCVIVGGVIGAAAGSRLGRKLIDNLTITFGVCALCMGISSIGQMQNMPAVVFSVIAGTALGTILHLGILINNAGRKMQGLVSGWFKRPSESPEEEYMSLLVTAIVLFCASGTGIYGAIDSGMTGDHAILLSKAIMDLFTSMIFACSLGAVVSVIALPQLVILLTLFCLAKMIYPLTTPAMIGDFKACGGMLLVATGIRMMKVKECPIAEMIPAMILVMPMSHLWVDYVMPLLG